MTPNDKSLREFATVLVFVAIVCALSAWLASESQGATVCRGAVCRPAAVQKIVTPVYAQAKVYAPAYYQVGAQLQQQAADTYAFRQSAEYLEYLRLKGFEAGVHALQSETAGTTPPHSDAPATANPPEPVGPDAIPPEPPPSETPAIEPNHYPTLTANCAKCHSGDQPKGDIWLDGTAPLDGPDAAVKRDAIVRMLWNGQMPPDKPAADEIVGAILTEIYAE